MCGVLAIARSEPVPHVDRRAEEARIDATLRVLSRRGPDSRGTWRSPCGRVALGHTRLAIQDLSDAGAQPMLAHDSSGGDVALSFNGEIYNAPTLRRSLESLGVRFRSRSDTEVILRGYIAWGFEPLLDALRGMFAIVLWDGRSRVLHAAVDHAGMKPLVFRESRDSLIIASDCDALRAACDEPLRPDLIGWCDVLCLGYCPAPRSVWHGVSTLGPGELLRWAPDHPVTRRRWWSAPSELRDDRCDEQFDDIWRTVVSEHLLSDVPLGLFLSGGIDSGAIAASLATHPGSRDVLALTASMHGGAFSGRSEDEAPAARSLAHALGMPHRSITLADADIPSLVAKAVRAYDQPHGATAILPAVAIAHAARSAGADARTVILAGDGGDEAFAGYAWHRVESHPLALARAADRRAVLLTGPQREALASPACDPADRMAAHMALGSLSFAHAALARQFPLFHPLEARALLAAMDPDYDEDAYAGWLTEHDRPSLPWRRRAQRLDVYGFCAGHVLPKVDRASMSVGLELRAPLLDRRVLEWGLSRPDDSAEDRAPGKRVLRDLLARLAGQRLPAGYLQRPKQGFSFKSAQSDTWHSLATGESGIDATRLVRDGLLRHDWRGFLDVAPEWRELRSCALLMLAAWWDVRAGAALPLPSSCASAQ